MQKYPICAFKELRVDAQTAIKEIQNISIWRTWNDNELLLALPLGFQEAKGFPELKFSSISSIHEKELKFVATLVSKEFLLVEWTILFQEEDHLMINMLLLSGTEAKAYYAKYAPALRYALKLMNRNFKTHTNRLLD